MRTQTFAHFFSSTRVSTKQEQPGLRSVHDYPMTAGLIYVLGSTLKVTRGRKNIREGRESQDGSREQEILNTMVAGTRGRNWKQRC